jgi:hypothetical protein
MKKCLVAGIVAACGLFACSSSEPKHEQSQAPLYESSREVTTVATVQSVDQTARKITLKGPEGNTISAQVDEKVRNLDQVKPGDLVQLTYIEAAAIQVVKKGERGEQDDVVVERAPEGEKPKGKVTRQVTRTAEIVNVDKSKGTITLRGPDDALTTVYVRRPEKLEGLKAGDFLKITYSEAVAVSVQPSPTEAK